MHEFVPTSLLTYPGPAHGQNLWRGNSLRKLKLLGGQPEGQCSKIKDIGGAVAPPASAGPVPLMFFKTSHVMIECNTILILKLLSMLKWSFDSLNVVALLVFKPTC